MEFVYFVIAAGLFVFSFWWPQRYLPDESAQAHGVIGALTLALLVAVSWIIGF